MIVFACLVDSDKVRPIFRHIVIKSCKKMFCIIKKHIKFALKNEEFTLNDEEITVMNEMTTHIDHLLLTHDCIILPGLGAVIAHVVPARIDEDRQVVVPPGRTFTFNVSLTHNDGLLVSSYARARSISFEAANAIVTAKVEQMKAMLQQDGVLTLGRVGVLRRNGETLSFEPCPTICLSPAYMWYREIDIVTAAELARRRDAATRSLSRGESLAHKVGTFSRVAASIALLVALSIVFTTPVKLDNAQYASLGVETFMPSSKATVTDKTNAALVQLPGRASSEITLHLYMHKDASEDADTASHNAYIRQRANALDAHQLLDSPVANNGFNVDAGHPYFVVVASLASADDADEFIRRVNDSTLAPVAMNGRYRVCAASASNLRDAKSAAGEIIATYPDAWVCRR